MGRSSGRSSYRPSRSSSTRSSRPPQTVKRAPAPAPAPAKASNGGSVLGSIATTVFDGFIWSTGSAVAHRVVDSLWGPRSIQHEIIDQPASSAAVTVGDACGTHSRAFQDCLNNYGSEISRCQFYLDMLSECKRNSGVTMSA